MLLCTNITFSYDRKPVLKDVSFSAKVGEWLGILGPNGSGKTTLIKCLAGILKPQSGKIEILPLPSPPPKGEGTRTLSQTIAVVPQESAIAFPFTAFEIVMMGRTPYQKLFGFDSKRDVKVATEAMQMTGTLQFADRQFGELSGGERQAVIIARALAQEPKVLLMDEPTAFLDIRHQQDILGLIKKLNEEKGITVISAMHDINLALLYCRSILFLKDGQVFRSGATNDVVTYASLKEVFGTEVYVGINDLNGRPYYLPYATDNSPPL